MGTRDRAIEALRLKMKRLQTVTRILEEADGETVDLLRATLDSENGVATTVQAGTETPSSSSEAEARTTARIPRGVLDAAVRKALPLMHERFTVFTMHEHLNRENFPFGVGDPKRSIGAVLTKLVNKEKVLAIRERGSGRQPTKYSYSAGGISG